MTSSIKSSESFFEELLAVTKLQFLKSKVFEKQLMKGERWNYSVCATPIVKNRPILFGINWGGKENEPQTSATEWDDISQYFFIKRSRKYLDEILDFNFSDINFNYTNFCFFRSPKGGDLETADYMLSIPLFEKYVRYINPPWLLCIGNTSFHKLNEFKLLTDIKTYGNGNSAKLWDWNVNSVPHPNAHLSNAKRDAIWEIIISEINKRK